MYLLTMDKLWKKRKAPTPLDWQLLENSGNVSELNMFVIFFLSIENLKESAALLCMKPVTVRLRYITVSVL